MPWPTKPLAQIAKRIGGGTPSRENPAYWGGDLPWFTVADLDDVENIQSLSESRERITRDGLEHSAAKLIPAGAVVFSSRVVVGKVGIALNDLATNQDFSSFIPHSEVEREFLAYFLIKAKYDLRAQQRGATIKGVTTQILDALPVPLPTLHEQRRIVARIKACMERIDEIGVLRDSLIPEVAALMRSARRELLGTPTDLPAGWHEEKLGVIADVIYGISEAISKNKDPALGPPIVRMANMSIEGWLDLSDLRYAPIPKGKEQHFALKPGDLLLNWRSGSPDHVGKTAIFNEEGLFTCASFILRIRTNPSLADNRYLRHVLNFLRAEGVFKAQSRMQINSKLNAKEFSAFPIRLPPAVSKQSQIADQLDAIESIAMRLQHEEAELDHRDISMRAAVLRKAFAGEL